MDNADTIILRKLNDPVLCEREARRHPELPDAEDLVQHFILDTSKCVDTTEDLMEQLYSCVDRSSSSESSASSASAGAKKKAKRKSSKDTKDKKVSQNPVLFHGSLN